MPLLALPSFHLSFQLPFLQKVARIFSLKQLSLTKKEPAIVSLGGITYVQAKAQKQQERAVTGSTAKG